MNLRRQGALGERTAEEYLIGRGAKLIARNYRAVGGEVDLIVKMDGATVFVEVKQRTTDRMGRPAEAVTRAKQARISRTALQYLQANKLLQGKVRFDVVEILEGEVRHIKGAFDYLDGAGR